jgi:hypothetical protein
MIRLPLTPTNNLYETSKIQAEQIVAETRDFRTRIFRPGAVIGHSTTSAVSGGFSGFYIFLRKLLQFQMALSRKSLGQGAQEPLRLLAVPSAPLNFIPVDLVTRQAELFSSFSTATRYPHRSSAYTDELIPLY